jgi:hypothetical protein
LFAWRPQAFPVRLGLYIFVSMLLLSAGFILAGWVMAYRLAPERRRSESLRWLAGWSIKGIFVPAVLWAFLNLGVSWNLQPLMPEVQVAQNTGASWVPAFLRVSGVGTFVVSSYWAAVTLAWVLVRTGKSLQGEEWTNFRALCLSCCIGLLVIALPILLLGGWSLAGVGGFVLLAPAAGYAPGILRPRKMPPMYARAIAKMKFGKYTEAEWEIIRQLENREDDFDGWMMLAELYASHFNDLTEAEGTILEICGQPKVTPSQVSVALHRLADWHLSMKADPDAARRALQVVVDRLPGSHLARMAQLRMQQLPATPDEVREAQAARPIPLPALGDSLEEQTPETQVDTDQAAAAAETCVNRLQTDPNNVEAREKLARLLAEQLRQPEQGIEQVLLLFDMPDQAEVKRAEWLSLAAAWNLKYLHDQDAARGFLERLAREFPGTPQAMAARRRLQIYPGH